MYPTTYDADIQRAVTRWWPQASWLRVKAQLIVESDLKPNAKSGKDAIGIAQFLPDTFAEWREFCGYEETVTPWEPVASINCCCAYMAHLYAEWRSPRPEPERWYLALASYNAGLGDILNAQRRANNSPSYADIIAQLPFVTGYTNALETQNYVKRIRSIYSELQS